MVRTGRIVRIGCRGSHGKTSTAAKRGSHCIWSRRPLRDVDGGGGHVRGAMGLHLVTLTNNKERGSRDSGGPFFHKVWPGGWLMPVLKGEAVTGTKESTSNRLEVEWEGRARSHKGPERTL